MIRTLVFLIIFAQVVQVDCHNNLSNYDFHGLGSGTSSIPCTEDPTNNHDWVFSSKLFSNFQLLLTQFI